MNYKFEKKVEKLLRDYGWYPERRVEISQYCANWKKEGYTLSQAAIQFTENMAGLRIVHGAYTKGNGEDESIFDPQKALDTIFYERVQEDYEKKIGASLCPIGVGFSEHLVYLITPTGAIYGGFDDYFCLIGENVESALENIFFDHNFKAL